MPFIGDGDMTVDVLGGRMVYGADLDQARAATAGSRLERAKVIVADCDTFPFAGQRLKRVAVADFDPYRNPYTSFRAFWTDRPKITDTFVCFFTDGQRQALMRVGKWEHPDGTSVEGTLNERRKIFHAYLSQQVWPWFEDYIKPWQVVHRMRYLHGWMVYWGAVLRMPTPGSDNITPMTRKAAGGFTPKKRSDFLEGIVKGMQLTGAAVMVGVDRTVVTKALEDDEKFAARYRDAEEQAEEAVDEALYQAAVSGNVQAARMWKELRGSAPATGVEVAGQPRSRVAALNAIAAGDPFDAELDGATG